MPQKFEGTWSYRSLLNNPDLSVDFNSLRFGMGTLVLSAGKDGSVSGSIGGPGWSLAITGTAKTGDPEQVLLEGRGMIDNEEWVYAYLGYVVPAWPNGVDQRDVIAGSVIRVVPHSNGQATAGFVASFYAVRQ
jgi:hypothetical protein